MRLNCQKFKQHWAWVEKSVAYKKNVYYSKVCYSHWKLKIDRLLSKILKTLFQGMKPSILIENGDEEDIERYSIDNYHIRLELEL